VVRNKAKLTKLLDSEKEQKKQNCNSRPMVALTLPKFAKRCAATTKSNYLNTAAAAAAAALKCKPTIMLKLVKVQMQLPML
jgi:hypothetical protein